MLISFYQLLALNHLIKSVMNTIVKIDSCLSPSPLSTMLYQVVMMKLQKSFIALSYMMLFSYKPYIQHIIASYQNRTRLSTFGHNIQRVRIKNRIVSNDNRLRTYVRLSFINTSYPTTNSLSYSI